LASGFYALIKYLNYEEVNGDQDKSQDEEKILDMAKKNHHHQRGDRGHTITPQRQSPRGSQRSQRSPNLGETHKTDNGNAPHYQEYIDGPNEINPAQKLPGAERQ
jgi:hypothetical protein